MTAKRETLERNDVVPVDKAVDIVKYARTLAVRQINMIQLMTYFSIGKWIVEVQQNGENRAKYNAQILKTLSVALTKNFGRGFSVDTLENFRKFYLTYQERISEALYRKFAIEKSPSILDQFRDQFFQNSVLRSGNQSSHISSVELAEEKSDTLCRISENHPPFCLSWSHYKLLMRIENPDERSFYEIESVNSNWTVRVLQRQYNSSLYERLALSRDLDGIKRLATEGETISSPIDILRQPTVLEFLGLEEKACYSESDLERALIDKLQRFLLELGKGYLFEARQKRFTLNEDNFYVDLVFYNRLLQCFVLIDLKVDKLTHQDLGQMQMYVNYYDRFVRTENENPTIGILLCKEKNQTLVEITLPENTNIFAAEYKLYLPDKELLKEKLDQWVDEINNN